MTRKKNSGVSSNIHQNQVSGVVSAISQDANLKEGRRGLLYIMIVYILRNFSSKENPRTLGEIMKIMKITFGFDHENKVKGIDERRLSDYVAFLENYSCLEERLNEEDSSAAMIRKQLGGFITHKGKKPKKYYFVSDYEYKDIDIVRSFIDVHNNQELKKGDVFTQEDLDYIMQLCDIFAPKVSADALNGEFEEFRREFALNREKLLLPIAESVEADKLSFIRKYRVVYDILKRQKACKGKAIVLQIKTGVTEQLYIPAMFLWEKNILYLYCHRKEDQSPTKIRLSDIKAINEVIYLYGKERINPLF